jgi:hypothetical protein
MKTILHFIGRILTPFIIQALIPVTSFAQWTAPINISPKAMKASMNENMGPCIATSHDTVHVIWSDQRTKGYAIYYSRSVDTGHTWSPAVAVTDTMGRASMPSLAVSGRNIHLVWMDSLKGIRASYYIRSVDGGNTWGTKICIDTNTVFWPGIAVSGSTVLVSLDKSVSGGTVVFLTKSIDNGVTWGAEQTISTHTGPGRSEDQATATDGKHIYMSWNDNRSGTMEIYYRRSADMCLTWYPEIAMSTTNSYTTMICLDSAHVDVVHGVGGHTWIKQSSDSGATWKPSTQVSTKGIYPFMVRKGQDIHIVIPQFSTSMDYIHSGDGGATWDSAVVLAPASGGFQCPFIALTCPVLHVVWPNAGKIYYVRNPTGNSSCSSLTGIANPNPPTNAISLYPNPVKNSATISFNEPGTHQINIYDITGRQVNSFYSDSKECTLPSDDLSPGVYFIKAIGEKSNQVIKFIKE